MRQGLLLSIYGVGVTFLVLGVLIVLIRVLLVLFPAVRPGEGVGEEAGSLEEEAHAAAVAAAWWYLNQGKDRGLGDRLTEEQGPWWDNNWNS